MGSDTFTRDRFALLDRVQAAIAAEPGRQKHRLAFQVAYCIATHIHREKGDCWLQQDQIGAMTGAERRGVQYALDWLVERGFIARTVRRGGSGSERGNRYWLVL